MDEFVNTHFHSDGSVLDSAATVDKLLDVIKEKGQPACALTDHGSALNLVDWYRGCKKRDIKPLLGCEFYYAYEGIQNREATKLAKTDHVLAVDSNILGNNHLVVIAKNLEGYRNICKMSSIAHQEGYYYSPRIDFEILKAHREGLIVTTACMFGSYSQLIDRGKYTEAEKFAGDMVEVFGDDFHCELQYHKFDAQAKYIPKAIEIAKKVGANLIVTQDVHYAKPEDWKFQDVLFCIGKKQKYEDPKRRQACKEMYIKSRAEMEAAFIGFNVPKIAFDNSLTIADKCESYELQPKDYLLPKFLGSKQLSDDKLKQLCREGWKQRLAKRLENNPTLKQRYTDRINYELAVIKAMGFSDYFLIVHDFLAWSKSKSIRCGAGRGSVGGSLVAYLLGITNQNIDPIEYNLLFERFLVPGRPTMPDIDVDVSDRDSVIAYLEEKYGRDKVSPILNRATVTAKAALGKVASVLGDYKLGQDISKIIKKVRGETPSFSEVLADVAELKVKKQEYPQLFELAEGLEGATLGLMGNASGVVISSVPISDVIPLHRSHDIIYSAFDKDQLSYMKMVKLDILGLDALVTIDSCIKLIKERAGKDIDIDGLEPTDPVVWDLICRQDTEGVFQLGTPLMRDLIGRIQPRDLVEAAIVNAMGRPGALDNPGLITSLVERKAGREEVIYPHPSLEELLKPSYGFILYQEQLMKMSQIMADFTIEEADKFRKGASDKRVEVIEEMRSKFMEGCAKNGHEAELAKSLFDQALLWAGYGFNASHSIEYSYMGYQTAWLKTYYPLEFLVACMNTQVGKAQDLKDITKFVMDLESHGYTVAPPDVTKSFGTKFTISETELDKNDKPIVYYSLGALKGVSPEQVDEWVKLRPFKDINDAFIKAVVTGCNSKNLSVLAAVGAFRALAPNTPYVVKSFEDRLEQAKKAVTRVKSKHQRQKAKLVKQMDMSLIPEPNWLDITQYRFDMTDDAELMATALEKTRFDTIKAERDLIGITVSGTMLDEYESGVRKHADMTATWFVNKVKDGEQVKVAGAITKLSKFSDKNGRRMAFITISDGRSDIRVVVFASVFNQFQDATWKVNKAIAVDGRKDKDSLIANAITFLRKDSDPYGETKEREVPDPWNF